MRRVAGRSRRATRPRMSSPRMRAYPGRAGAGHLRRARQHDHGRGRRRRRARIHARPASHHRQQLSTSTHCRARAAPAARSSCARFIETLEVGDTRCAAAAPPVRLVPRFARHAARARARRGSRRRIPGVRAAAAIRERRRAHRGRCGHAAAHELERPRRGPSRRPLHHHRARRRAGDRAGCRALDGGSRGIGGDPRKRAGLRATCARISFSPGPNGSRARSRSHGTTMRRLRRPPARPAPPRARSRKFAAPWRCARGRADARAVKRPLSQGRLLRRRAPGAFLHNATPLPH